MFLSIFALNAQASGWHQDIIADAKAIYVDVANKTFSKPIEFIVAENDSAAASARHEYEKLVVEINTGLLKNKRLTPDSFRMIICHELGHLFGGAPRRNTPPEWEGPIGNDGLSMMSSEGQADYYASTSCFKMLTLKRKNIFPYSLDLKRVGPVLKNKCATIAGFKNEELELCYRSSLAGLDFLNLVKDFPISCELHDDSIADETIRDSYPDRQCRLDTFIIGSLCKNVLPLSMNEYDDAENTCPLSFAERPKCWFRSH